MAEMNDRIPNHFTPNLSELDLLIAKSVPPGGNWKNIPESVPSQRIKQIRESCAAGKGSRSTYYGRLHPDAPSFTISTYIGRPGNGCHIHYDYNGGQHRVISQREAARLQSFPDNFVFMGSKTAVNQQIGNAVPPLLAYQIAKSFPFKGQFIDLFSGAGGLALGFLWAGWQPLVANDIESNFLKTYSTNIHMNVVAGDLRESKVFKEIVAQCKKYRSRNKNIPLFVLGGPPCQGFSTAGKRRSMADERNWLFTPYKTVLEALKPSGFIFENVPGLLNMEGGKVFKMISNELSSVSESISVWKLATERYGVPQRRTRVFLVGNLNSKESFAPPNPVTEFNSSVSLLNNLTPAITVEEALSDLPPLVPGEDGSMKNYLFKPQNDYQRFMRSQISAQQYVASLMNKL